jgi:hypothetical protein
VTPGAAELCGPCRKPAQRERVATSRPLCEPANDRFHLIDFGLLARDDAGAKLPDFGVPNRGLLAHEDRPGVMRDHRSQELLVANGLCWRMKMKNAASATKLAMMIAKFSLALWYIARIRTTSMTIIGAVMRPAI